MMSLTEKEIDELLDLDSQDELLTSAVEKKSLDFDDEEDINIGNLHPAIQSIIEGETVSFSDAGKKFYGQVIEVIQSGEVEGEMHSIKIKMHADKEPVAIIKCVELVFGKYIENGTFKAYPLRKLSKDSSFSQDQITQEDKNDIFEEKSQEIDEFDKLFPALSSEKRSKKQVLTMIDNLLEELKNSDEDLDDL